MFHHDIPFILMEFITLCCDRLEVIYILTSDTTNKFIKSKIACYIFQLSWTYFRYKST
jgi:hypothetical protein